MQLESRTRSRTTSTLASVWCALVLSACYASSPCSVEHCDGLDNDCDGKVDEAFTNARGVYTDEENCGACGVVCDSVFPTAARTECKVEDTAARCRITACRDGQRLVDGNTCVASTDVLCMACDRDEDCSRWSDGALCLRDATGSRCGRACKRGSDCPDGFVCEDESGSAANQCAPASGSCSCQGALIGASFGCLVHSRSDRACAGIQSCTERGLTACEAALLESCNGADDDCDDAIDEDFVDQFGRYASVENCGACGARCLPNAPHSLAACVVDGDTASCSTTCEPGFVDVDGLAVTGCECELQPGPGIVIGADGDCDGHVDPTPKLIFVAPNGDDDNDGTDVAHPLRTITRGITQGRRTGRTVLVARGIYQGPVELREGVTLLGGYSPDFRQRDTVLYPVMIEGKGAPGAPVLLCREIQQAALIDGVTVVGGDADQPSTGSTAVYLDGCGSAVTLSNVTVLAGRAAAGGNGADSSANLSKWELSSLTDLTGGDGAPGAEGGDGSEVVCESLPAGAGGVKSCPRRNVSGGDGGTATCPDLTAVCVNGSGMPCGNAGCTDFTDGDGTCDLDAAKAVAIAGPSASPGRGRTGGAAGEPTYAAPNNRGVCDFCDDNPTLPRGGVAGADGGSGADGAAGAACMGLERADLAVGLVAAGDGGDGRDGADGSGGGGATAGSGFAVIGNTTDTCNNVSGGSGGGGGSGGCGAPNAFGGGGGGASIGVMIRVAAGAKSGPTLSEVRIVTGSGGEGGRGGIGAAGGTGGAGGLGGISHFWCARNGGRGGDGGSGGSGGAGAGGCGGGSYGVYLVGDASTTYQAVVLQQAHVERTGVAGRGGAGGFSPGRPGAAGSDGQAMDLITVD